MGDNILYAFYIRNKVDNTDEVFHISLSVIIIQL